MSQKNVEIVRQAVLAGSDGAFSRFEAASDPSIEWDMSDVTGWVEQEIYRGPAGTRFPGGLAPIVGGVALRGRGGVRGVGGQVLAGIHEVAKGAHTTPASISGATSCLPCATARSCEFKCSATGRRPSKPWGCGSSKDQPSIASGSESSRENGERGRPVCPPGQPHPGPPA
jgi:hypothetical protein